MTVNVTSEFDAERERLAGLTRRGIGMPAAGLVFWIAFAILVRALPMKTALIFAFAGTGLVFPLGFLLTRLAGGDLFAKSKSLTPLGMMLNFVQLFYWPVMIVVFRVAREWTPFVMGVLFSSHFLPYAWMYRSAGYATLAISTTFVLTAGIIVTGGPMYTLAPILTAACYAGSLVLLTREVVIPRSAATRDLAGIK